MDIGLWIYGLWIMDYGYDMNYEMIIYELDFMRYDAR